MNQKARIPKPPITRGTCLRCQNEDTVILVYEYEPNDTDCYLCGDCLHDLLTAVDEEDARRMGAVVIRQARQ
jgi:hypothetical protein